MVLRKNFKVLPDFANNFFKCFNFRSLVALNVFVVKSSSMFTTYSQEISRLQ